MEDREMFKATCSDCGKECEVPFEPTPGKPVRCQDCFKKSRPQRSFGGNNSRGRFGGNGGRFGNNRRQNNGPREMHKATCASCKKQCEVPFKPTGDKPVYCRDCYNKN